MSRAADKARKASVVSLAAVVERAYGPRQDDHVAALKGDKVVLFELIAAQAEEISELRRHVYLLGGAR